MTGSTLPLPRVNTHGPGLVRLLSVFLTCRGLYYVETAKAFGVQTYSMVSRAVLSASGLDFRWMVIRQSVVNITRLDKMMSNLQAVIQ